MRSFRFRPEESFGLRQREGAAVYEIEAHLGGTVYRAVRRESQSLHPSESVPGAEVVALKRLRAPADPQWLASVRDQTLTLAGLSHPSLIRIHEVTTDADELQINMQYFAEGSLADTLERKGPLPGPSVAVLIAEVADALAVAHNHGLLHLDIKPSNILLDSKGWPALSDFGHSRLTAATGQPTPANAEYFDPALAEGQAPGPSSDIYSLGVVCYQAIAGALPFSGDTPLQVLRNARTQPLPPLVQAAPGTSPALAAAVEQAMARRPQDRFQTADDLSLALRGAIGMPVVDFGGPARARRARPELAWPWRRTPAAQPVPVAASDSPSTPHAPPAPPAPPRRHPRPERAGSRRSKGVSTSRRLALWTSRNRQSGMGLALVGMMVFASLILPRVLSSRIDRVPNPESATTEGSRAPRPENIRDDADIPSETPLAEGGSAERVAPPAASRQPPGPKAQAQVPDANPPVSSSEPARSETAQLAPAPAPQPPAPAPAAPAPAPASKASTFPVRPPAQPGRRIIFTSSSQEGNREIYAVNDDGSGLRNLTRNAADDRQPAWSPDGSEIAFASDREGNNDIYIIKADGSGIRRLTENGASDLAPAWSPDGSKIAFASDREGRPKVYIVNAGGGGERRLSENPGTQPVWSPDGSKIAFASFQKGANTEIHVIDVDGSAEKEITENPAVELEPDWSSDGRVVFTTTRDGVFPRIYMMNADGSAQTKVTSGQSPAWSTGGTRLAFCRLGSLYVQEADGSQRRIVSGKKAADTDW